ncbi:MAG: hypothetical protein IJZ25_01000 [Lachnospiraceae bacterium]|nr:hypothetical protein [Lachnospiraceae bacterium]
MRKIIIIVLGLMITLVACNNSVKNTKNVESSTISGENSEYNQNKDDIKMEDGNMQQKITPTPTTGLSLSEQLTPTTEAQIIGGATPTKEPVPPGTLPDPESIPVLHNFSAGDEITFTKADAYFNPIEYYYNKAENEERVVLYIGSPSASGSYANMIVLDVSVGGINKLYQALKNNELISGVVIEAHTISSIEGSVYINGAVRLASDEVESLDLSVNIENDKAVERYMIKVSSLNEEVTEEETIFAWGNNDSDSYDYIMEQFEVFDRIYERFNVVLW